jgi:HEAT repeat protein
MLWFKMRNLRSSDEATRRNAVEALAAYSGRKDVVNAIAATSIRDDCDRVRQCAVGVLQGWGSISVAPLGALAQRELPFFKVRALEVLSRIEKGRATELCMTALKDANCRMGVAGVLEKIAETSCVRPLLESIKDDDKDYEFRRTVATALSAIGPEAVPHLCHALSDTMASRRFVAALALGEIGDIRGLDPIMRALKGTQVAGPAALVKIVTKGIDSISEERAASALRAALSSGWAREHERNAVSLLMKLKGTAATEALVLCLKQSNDLIVRWATQELKTRQYQPANRDERISLALAQGDWQKLVQIGPPAVKALTGRMWDSNDALQALVKIADPGCVDPIIRMLEHGGESGDWGRQKPAAEALREIGDARSLYPLIRILTSGHFAWKLADHLLDAISAVLARAHSDASIEVLRELAALPEKFEVSFKRLEYSTRPDSRAVDCSVVISAAKAELRRRYVS